MLLKSVLHAPALSALALAVCVACGGNPDLVVSDYAVNGSGNEGGEGNAPGPQGPVVNVGGDNGEGNEGGGFSCDPSDSSCQTEQPGCGDGLINTADEVCDDGNSVPGDGCSGICTVEPNFDCPPTGGPCRTNIVCGDGQLGGGEVCDDANDSDGDGCAADCQSIEPDFDCSVPGEKCVDMVVCGDGQVTGDESCDDKGAPGGCKDDCSGIQAGWICLRPGRPCIVEPGCGDGVLNLGEQCDDGNEVDGDGCDTKPGTASPCTSNPNYSCVTAGQPCLPHVCGDGVRTPDEACDDGVVKGSGCTACQVDSGWVCPLPGAPCIPKCGDRKVTAYEACDDGNINSGDGCSAGCQLEPSFYCDTPGAACAKTKCGDKQLQGDEGCDDGNLIAGDGCGPTCQNEPKFVDGKAQVVCGDGSITGSEQCDDGNANDGDGCSAICKTEPEFSCRDYQYDPASVQLAVTYRDVRGRQDSSKLAAGEHPDFEWKNQGEKGIPGDLCTLANAATCGRLGSDLKPILAKASSATILDATSYSLWYHDDTSGTPLNARVDSSITLDRKQVNGVWVYQFDNSNFFPLTDLAFGNYKTTNKNFHFTTEIQYFFQYRGSERLDFSGDDDVWVFVNGRLAVDLGGVHGVQGGFVLLGDENADGSLSTAEAGDDVDDRFGITKGELYTLSLFHAERHTSASNFKLTLTNFIPRRSLCKPVCGNSALQRGEVCDDGAGLNQDGVYGVCNATCSGREFCGDGIKNGPEECDNGTNISEYSTVGANACAPGCKLPGRCGDGVVKVGLEYCDDGMAKNVGGYDGCTSKCELGPYCGDGLPDAAHGELCDDGSKNGGYGKVCGYDCKPAPSCGDGVRNGPEQCDLGKGKNVGGYGGCNPDCTRAARCGDGTPQEEDGELCDDGVNAGGYGQCAPECQLGPRCGDGVVQKGSGEQCDDGDNLGGYGKCAPGCKFGPRCGDSKLQKAYGEECDDGNTKNGDSCSSVCKKPSGPK